MKEIKKKIWIHIYMAELIITLFIALSNCDENFMCFLMPAANFSSPNNSLHL